jgi:hypothetical protein
LCAATAAFPGHTLAFGKYLMRALSMQPHLLASRFAFNLQPSSQAFNLCFGHTPAT